MNGKQVGLGLYTCINNSLECSGRLQLLSNLDWQLVLKIIEKDRLFFSENHRFGDGDLAVQLAYCCQT